MKNHNILLIDDQKAALNSMSTTLQLAGYHHLHQCSDSRNVENILNSTEITLALLDLTMPYISGEALIEIIKTTSPYTQIIVITGHDNAETAVRCLKLGAIDYLTKPITPERLLTSIQTSLEISLLKNEVHSLRETQFKNQEYQSTPFESIITNHKVMHKIFRYMQAISLSNHPTLIYGETGTGKELIAHALHKLSRRTGKFIAINISGLDENMFSDTLFGHVKGAFTGAEKTKTGLIEAANNGTLFLDEIGDLTPTAQVKLLRFLQEKEFLPLGAEKPRTGNCTIITATNINLNSFEENLNFRQDLFYRLNDHFINLPPLRERKGDIPLLINHYLKTYKNQQYQDLYKMPNNIQELLTTHSYPGNIRELQKIIYEISQIPNGDQTQLQDVLERFKITKQMTHQTKDIQYPSQLPTLKQAHQQLIQEALKRTQGNQTLAAKLLGVTPQALSQAKKRQQ